MNRKTSAIVRTPVNVMIKKLLKYTFSLLTNGQRTEIIQEMASNDVSNLALLGFDSVANGEASKFQQYSQQIVKKLKGVLAKLNPNSEIVSKTESLGLVI